MTTPVPVAASVTLNAVKLAGPGATVDFLIAKAQVTSVVVVTGEVTGGLVALEASHDGTNWVFYGSAKPRTGVNQPIVSNVGAFRYWRANVLSAIVGSGSVTATLMEAG